ncbi:MAG: serine protease [Proteobacteria bacterium]|nr:serine protease [Pseudomonadota bacterium]
MKIVPASASETVMYSTVLISVELDSGFGYGTGFLFRHKLNNHQFLDLIITNKHVVEGAKTGVLKFHTRGPDAALTIQDKTEDVAIDKFEEKWFHHPDPAIDLCAMPFQPIYQTIKSQVGAELFMCSIGDDCIPSEQVLRGLRAIEEITMIGYPTGLGDMVNNYPIFRRGITASHPAVDFNGKPLGVVDLACFPGSSGSPIFLLNEGSYSTKNTAVMAGSRLFLLGILFEGPVMQSDGSISIVKGPRNFEAKVQTETMIHLGYYIKARELMSLCKSFLESTHPVTK